MAARAIVALVVVFVALTGCASDDAPSRQDEVAARAAEVMPFDLDKTRHYFDKTADGGVESVVVIDPSDAENIRLIREHLASEAEKFQNGDYSDPAYIHGEDMPGLDLLRTAGTRVRIEYTELVDGGQITYTATEPELIDAIHDWFDAQTMDHGGTGHHM